MKPQEETSKDRAKRVSRERGEREGKNSSQFLMAVLNCVMSLFNARS
jgi:hypothetical protein